MYAIFKHKKNLPTHRFWLESHCVKGQQVKGNLKKYFFFINIGKSALD